MAVSTSSLTFQWQRTKISDSTTVVVDSVVSSEIGTAGFDVGDTLVLTVTAADGSGYTGSVVSNVCVIK